MRGSTDRSQYTSSLWEGILGHATETQGRDYHRISSELPYFVYILQTFKHQPFPLLSIISCAPNASSLRMASTSRATMGDVVVVMRVPSNGEDRTRFLSQGGLYNGDLQGREPLYRNSGSISLRRI
jgi:hypothetical protein